MSKKTTVTISVLIFILYAATLLFFAGSIFFEVRQGASQGAQQFSAIKEFSGSESDKSGFMTPDFIEQFKNRLSGSGNLAAVTLQQSGKTVFAWPVHGEAIRVNGAMEPAIQTSSPIIKVFSANFPFSENGQAVVTAAFYVVTPQNLEKFAKQAFLFIMAGTVIALLSGVLSYALPDKKAEEATEAGVEKSVVISSVQVSEEHDVSKAPGSELDETLYEKEISSLFEDDYSESVEENVDSTREAETVRRNSSATEKSKLSASIDPMGLFSPKTGLGWESYLETRLDAELIRSASSERDLALLLVCVEGAPHGDERSAQAAETLLEYFNYRDMLFEFGTDSYAVIIQDSEFDNTMRCAEDVYADMQKKGQPHKPLITAIGISTRAQRLITGSRLINEAATALKKAKEEKELPIVAFKVNTEKYRKYLNEELRSGLVKKNRTES